MFKNMLLFGGMGNSNLLSTLILMNSLSGGKDGNDMFKLPLMMMMKNNANSSPLQSILFTMLMENMFSSLSGATAELGNTKGNQAEVSM